MTDHDRQATIDALRDLAVRADDPALTADEHNHKGLTCDVDHYIGLIPAFFNVRVVCTPTGCDVDAEWRGDKETLAAIRSDVFRLLGELSEHAQFVFDEIARDHVLYRVLVHSQSFGVAHAHFMTIRIRGQNVQRVIQKAADVRSSFERLPRDAQGRFLLPISVERADVARDCE